MQVNVQLTQGYLPDTYTKYSQTTQSGQPVISFPIMVTDVPAKTTHLALSLIDYDAVPRTGFPFIHWLAADLPVMNVIPADFSRNFQGPQGQNTWGSRFYNVTDTAVTTHYAGPTPPDKPHRYTLTVYALDAATGLEQGFFYNDFRQALKYKLIDRAEIDLPAKN